MAALIATKPYVSSAAYIDRMSDYCTGCHYDKKPRHGDEPAPSMRSTGISLPATVKKLAANPRLALVYRQLAKMAPDARIAAQGRAAEIRAGIEDL